MDLFERINNISLRTRMIIAVIIAVFCMSVVVYIWYASFTNSLSGSFEVVAPSQNSARAIGSQSINDESFFASLRSLVGDINFGMGHFSEIRESFTNIFSQ